MNAKQEQEVERLAQSAADAMAALGTCGIGTWQERKAALLSAGEAADSGFGEVVVWLQGEE